MLGVQFRQKRRDTQTQRQRQRQRQSKTNICEEMLYIRFDYLQNIIDLIIYQLTLAADNCNESLVDWESLIDHFRIWLVWLDVVGEKFSIDNIRICGAKNKRIYTLIFR